jgi:hypothetical protein
MSVMPEYLSPGVYVEEVSFRSKSIEGVPTSTTGMAGMTLYGPVRHSYLDGAAIAGPKTTAPRLITSFREFERVYGGLAPLAVGPRNAEVERLPYLAYAARAFFANGGKRLYVARVYAQHTEADADGVARLDVPLADGPGGATWRARWPGRAGNVRVVVEVQRSRDLAYIKGAAVQARRVYDGAVVAVLPAVADTPPPAGVDAPDLDDLRVVRVDADGAQTFHDRTGAAMPVNDMTIQLLELRVRVDAGRERQDEYGDLSTEPTRQRYIGRVLQKDDPADEDCMVWLEWDPEAGSPTPAQLQFRPATALHALASASGQRLTGGLDGRLALANDLAGQVADPDHVELRATGLAALAEVDDISIVALPDSATYAEPQDCVDAVQKLIDHVTDVPYRIAVVDAPAESSINEVREFRGKFDSSHAALYHPWLDIKDPNESPFGGPPRYLSLPPSGAVAGVYARTDVQRGVHKAPANEVITGLSRFAYNITTPRQDVLNPEGINALRALERRGNRVWGARTMSSDPEWKYVNVRRLFNYIEHSIDRSTQWAVFEPNNRRLWDNVRRAIQDFLRVLWRDGALLGDREEDAFFVTCDRTTMTQNDLDNGRLICLVGVAPVMPAEFVIIKIGQWTADAKQ